MSAVATATASKPPANVGKNALWALTSKYKNSLDRIKKIDRQTVARTTDTVMRVVAGAGTSFGVGVLFAKFPKAAKIAGKVDTLMVGGLGGIVIGAGLRISGNEWGSAILSMGEGMAYPWLFMKGGEVGAKIGA